MKENLWELIQIVKLKAPLVQNITNYVVMNNSANALLAIGASPLMAHASDELSDILNISNALVINIGTLDESWEKYMLSAAQLANEIKKPWVLDPVGAGASNYRNRILLQLLNYHPTVIRGNASEIIALSGISKIKSKGVDSTNKSENAIVSAKLLAEKYKAVVCISGETDIILKNESIFYIKNGHALMTKVTGLGCSASALIGAFVGVTSDYMMATIAAMSLMGVAGQLAQQISNGPGSLQVNLLDKLYSLTESEFFQMIQIS